MIYTGIGSRETPEEVLILFRKIAENFAVNGFTLRSGAAPGADSAFEEGCDLYNGPKEIYLPWIGFNNSSSNLIGYNKLSSNFTRERIKNYDNLKPGVQKLFSRNACQVLGLDLSIKSTLVVCYTKGGKFTGGTSIAMNIAKSYDIPIFNAGNYTDLIKFKKEILTFINRIQKAVI